MPLVEVAQQSPEWLLMRTGMVTASCVKHVVAKRANGSKTELKCRADYRSQVISEILTGRSAEHYVTPAMEWGIEHEGEARATYELRLDREVLPGGFAIHDRIPRFGASPDGLIGEDGCVEFKCPTTTTHLDWMIAGVVPEEHKAQMDAEMACANRKWCDFVSFDPRLPKKLQLFIRPYLRDDERIAAMEDAVQTFLEEIIATIKMLEAA